MKKVHPVIETGNSGYIGIEGVLTAEDNAVLRRTLVFPTGLVDELRRIIYRLAFELKDLKDEK